MYTAQDDTYDSKKCETILYNTTIHVTYFQPRLVPNPLYCKLSYTHTHTHTHTHTNTHMHTHTGLVNAIGRVQI